jgi:hypothetical protein
VQRRWSNEQRPACHTSDTCMTASIRYLFGQAPSSMRSWLDGFMRQRLLSPSLGAQTLVRSSAVQNGRSWRSCIKLSIMPQLKDTFRGWSLSSSAPESGRTGVIVLILLSGQIVATLGVLFHSCCTVCLVPSKRDDRRSDSMLINHHTSLAKTPGTAVGSCNVRAHQRSHGNPGSRFWKRPRNADLQQ